MAPDKFEEMLYYVAAAHCEELLLKNTRNLSLDVIALDVITGDNVCVNVYIPELRAMLCDIYERAYEEGYSNGSKEVSDNEGTC